MRCVVHSEREAVAICAHCGKGACAECAGSSASGRIVCSPKCAASPTGRSYTIKGYLFHVLGAILVVAGLFFVVQGPWSLSVFLAIAGIICFYNGIRPGGEGA